MSESDEKTVVERLEACEQGLTAIETILRATFPQFFQSIEVCKDGDQETISSTGEGSGEVEEETSGEEKTGEETAEIETE